MIFSGSLAATSSMSMPPDCDAITACCATRPIEGDREVELPVDRRGLLDQHLEDLDALGRGLRRLEHHAEDLLGRRLRPGGIVGQLDPAALAAAARVHLGLHHHLAAEALGDGARLRGRVGHLAVRHRDAELLQNGLALILVNFHWASLRSAILHRRLDPLSSPVTCR